MGKMICGLILGLILVLGVFIAGCSDQSTESTSSAVPTTAATTAKYAAGDIVGRSATQAEPLWLILSYVENTDQYERALIYKNTDGSWGHRNDIRTEKFSRQSMEKIYPVKVSHVTLSAIPVVTPTAFATATVTSSGYSPRILQVSPTSATKDSIVSLTITGSDFQSGAQVKLTQAGKPSLYATSVSVSSSQITCMFNLNGLDTGYATVDVRNPDGQSDSLSNVFSIGEVSPLIKTVSPLTGGLGQTLSMTITGLNFEDAVKVTLTSGSSEIVCLNPRSTPPSKIICDLYIPTSATRGSYSVSVLNIASHTSGYWSSTIAITNSTV